MTRRLARTAAAALLGALLSAPPALADAKSVGENLSDQLGGLARAAFIGIVAVVSLVFLMNRRMTELAVFIGAALVVGAFALAPDSTADTLRSTVESIVGK